MIGLQDIHIDDLARPRLPWPLRATNVLAPALARRLYPFDVEGMLARARRETRLDDFGDVAFREPLGALLRSLEQEAGLSGVGRLGAGRTITDLLRNRLRLEALIDTHPAVLDELIKEPLVITGLPRSGTTHLHTLLSLHPALRSLPLWESLEPVPSERSTSAEDPRLTRCRKLIRHYYEVLPLMRAMHEIGPTLPHEEIQLLAMDFRSLLFEVGYRVPSYAAWYTTHDQTSGYRYLKRALQALQWQRGPRRWVLKTPQHLEMLPALFNVFPDARIVQTHRDPVAATASFCTMMAYGARFSGKRIDLREIGRYWSRRIEEMLAASLRDRARLLDARFLDVNFDDFAKDNMGTVQRVLAFAGLDLDPPTRLRMEQYNVERPRFAHGRIVYRLEDFGIDAVERREAFRFYEPMLLRHGT